MDYFSNVNSFTTFNGKLGTSRAALKCLSELGPTIRKFEFDYLVNRNIYFPTICLSFYMLRSLYLLKIGKSK